MTEKRFVLEISSFSGKHMKFLNILDNGKRLSSEDIVDLLNEQQSTIEEQNKLIEKLRWDLNKTREDLNYFANLKVMAMKGCEPNE